MSTPQIPGPVGAAAVKPLADPGLHLPRLGDIVTETRRLLVQALAETDRDVDPASVPADSDAFGAPGYVLSRIMCARADIRSALKSLAEITDDRLPAVKTPALRTPGATSGVPVGAAMVASAESGPNPQGREPGEAPTPGAAAVAPASAGEAPTGATTPVGAGVSILLRTRHCDCSFCKPRRSGW